MKRFLLLMAVTLSAALSASAQRTISGTVVDKDANEAVIQATVALMKTDSTLVGNAVTNANGQFSLTAPQDGNFLLRITYVGYKTLFRNVAMSGKPVQLGTLKLETDSKMLKDVEVVKNQARVYSKEDTIIYNAGAYKTPEGSVIEELVKRLPGAQVGDDGKITINGKEVKKIKVDGKEFMTGDTQTAMKNLPTSIVERVKAYDEKSDLTRITGIDDGEEQTVLDFGIKRGMNKGTILNVDAGVGTKDRYTSRLFGIRMQDGLRVMAMGNANNVGDRGFNGGGGGGRFGGGGGGLSAPKMGGVNLNYEKTGTLKLDGSVRYNHSNSDSWSRTATENFISTVGAFSNSVSQRYSRGNQWNGQMRIEWTPDTLWNIHFRPSFSWSNSDSKSSSVSASFSQDPYSYVNYTLNNRSTIFNALNYMRQNYPADSLVVNSRDNGSMSYSDNNRLGGELQINRKLSSNGRNITLRLTGNYTDGDSKSLSLEDVTLYQLMNYQYSGDSAYMKNRYNLTPNKNYDYSARLTYSEPIAKQTYLQFSYNFQYRYTENDRSTYDFSTPTPYPTGTFGDLMGIGFRYRDWDRYLDRLTAVHSPLDYYHDDSLSQYSQYKNYIHTGEVMLRVVRQAYNFNVGVQVIPQTSKLTYRYLGKDYGTTTRNVVNWSPTANFRWKMSDSGQMQLQYRGNTSQPSMTDLLAITDDTDPLNITTGNAGLKPSFTQNVNWRVNNYWQKHQRFFFANVRYSTTSNSVTSVTTYDPKTGGRRSTRENINGNWNTSADMMFNTAIDTTGYFNLSSFTNFSFAHSVSLIDLNRDGNIMKNYANETTLGERLGASYRNDSFEFELNGGISYTFGRNHLQSQGNQDIYSFNYGFNTTYYTPWGMQLTTNLNMQSRRGYADKSMNTNELIWNAQIAQSFLQGKPLSVRLEFYDILHNQSNFSRTLNAMMRSDSESNAINSYVMLRVNYRLNIFGTNAMRQGMRMGPGGPGGPDGNRGSNRGGGFGGGRGGFGGPGFGGPGRM
ncbi:MAG: TonB-dependent receptor [Prevotella sp.]|nr:TonB-dependent receptor [Prevotella sp.]